MPEFDFAEFAAFGALPLDLSLLPAGEKVLVAVSGGADSLALLGALLFAKCKLCVAHINHNLRGRQSEDDAAFVAAHAGKLNVAFVSARLDLAPNANEAAMRAARYEALIKLARENFCPIVATGHTASDLLETVLLNFLRESSVSGLAGIAAARELAPGLTLVRPLLSATREQTRQACRAANWTWREDASNENLKFRRNHVRGELVPLLQQISGRDETQLARQTLRAAQILRDDLELLDDLARRELTTLCLHREDSLLVLDGLRFRALPKSLARRVLREAARQLRGDLQDISFERIEAVRLHINADGPRAVWQWRRGLSVEWTGAMSGNRIRLRRV